ncbi:MAG: hypothetical protein ABI562_06880 [Chloroflexota bacterium]
MVVSLVGGVLLGTAATGSVVAVLVTIVLGGLIYQDIIRRDRRSI